MGVTGVHLKKDFPHGFLDRITTAMDPKVQDDFLSTRQGTAGTAGTLNKEEQWSGGLTMGANKQGQPNLAHLSIPN